jgi:LacI family transcriptional regulator
VPEQVALIGVENDEFVCNCSRPSLSSIQPANRDVGYRAAVELDRLMRGIPGDWRVVLRNPVEKLVERESSRVLPPAGHLIRDALAYIRENACNGLRASDVSRHLHVSRRLLDLRFNQIQKSSVLDAITEVRINEAKRRLEKTGDSMSEIATACGYRSAARLSKAFRARTGLTPSDWRAGKRPPAARLA